jgi:hypothetical protein
MLFLPQSTCWSLAGQSRGPRKLPFPDRTAWRGAFSFYLQDTLQQTGAALSYRDAAGRAASHLCSDHAQHPAQSHHPEPPEGARPHPRYGADAGHADAYADWTMVEVATMVVRPADAANVV